MYQGIAILLILCWTNYSEGACAYFQFTQQPPSEPPCNPYDSPDAGNVWRLRMQCAVQRLSGQNTFDVHWFQRYINGTVVDHGRPSFFSDGVDMETVEFGGHLINKPPSDAFLGEYWCQVVDTTVATDVQYLGISDSIVIEDYTFYGNRHRCTGIISDNTDKCADTAPASSTPIPIVTTSSSSQATSTTSTQDTTTSTAATSTTTSFYGNTHRCTGIISESTDKCAHIAPTTTNAISMLTTSSSKTTIISVTVSNTQGVSSSKTTTISATASSIQGVMFTKSTYYTVGSISSTGTYTLSQSSTITLKSTDVVSSVPSPKNIATDSSNILIIAVALSNLGNIVAIAVIMILVAIIFYLKKRKADTIVETAHNPSYHLHSLRSHHNPAYGLHNKEKPLTTTDSVIYEIPAE